MEPLAKNENDHLGFFLDKSIRAITKDETIFFSDKLIKVNRYGMNQERNILITNKAIYNLKKKTLKRRIEIGWTRGITVSKITDEFVVHGSDAEYDYNFISPKKKKIIEFISKSFFELAKKELALCELESKSLKNVVTSKKEKKKDANFSRMPETFLIPVYNYLYGTKDDNLVLNKKSATVVRNDTFYSKRKEIKEVKLEEFKILKLLGRGTFGKVCLVEYIPTGELYAMKSLKKSVLLDQEQIENTLLEKKILESLEHPFLIEMMFYFTTQERIYFVMPFMRGGELFQHLRRFKIFSEEKY
jgi:serum/glucocorticoid-regulated kinase 2